MVGDGHASRALFASLITTIVAARELRDRTFLSILLNIFDVLLLIWMR